MLGIGRKFQTPSVFKHLTLVENLTLALHQPRGVWSTLFGAVGTAQMDKIAPTLATLGLLEKAHHKAGSLAHGEMQWLEIGMVIVQEPALFLLDEPVAGMTKDERERTGQLLQRLAQDHAVLVVEHDMEFVRQTAHRVTVLHEGSILCEGSVDMVQRDPVWSRSTWAEGIRSMLTIRSLNVSYGDSQVLWDVHLDVRQVRWMSPGS